MGHSFSESMAAFSQSACQRMLVVHLRIGGSPQWIGDLPPSLDPRCGALVPPHLAMLANCSTQQKPTTTRGASIREVSRTGWQVNHLITMGRSFRVTMGRSTQPFANQLNHKISCALLRSSFHGVGGRVTRNHKQDLPHDLHQSGWANQQSFKPQAVVVLPWTFPLWAHQQKSRKVSSSALLSITWARIFWLICRRDLITLRIGKCGTFAKALLCHSIASKMVCHICKKQNQKISYEMINSGSHVNSRVDPGPWSMACDFLAHPPHGFHEPTWKLEPNIPSALL